MRKPVLLICFIALTALAGDPPAKEPRQVARYRLAHARVSVATPDGRMLAVDSMFKIDSQTGETWIYKANTSTTNIVEGWVRLKDLSL